MRTTCRKCGRSFRGSEDYCEPCDEFRRQVARENRVRYVMMCTRCGEPLTIQHAFHHKRRDGDFPQGKRHRMP